VKFLKTKRVCKKCGEEKEIGEFHRNHTCSYGRLWTCKKCAGLWAKEWLLKNPISKVVKTKYYKKYQQKPRSKAKRRAFRRKYEKAMPDSFIKSILRKQTNMKYRDITQQMIELKRIQLKFFREIKKGKEALNEVYKNV